MKLSLVFSAVIGVFGLAVFSAKAATIAITNADFEANILANPGAQNDNFTVTTGQGATITPAPGWTFGYNQIDNYSAYAGISDLAAANLSSEGALDNNIVWLFVAANKQTTSVWARQTLSATVELNTRYTLTLRVAQAARAEGNPSLPNPIFPTLGNGVDTGNVFARLRAGNATTAMPGFLSSASSVSAPGDHEWVNWTLVWETGASEALAGQALMIELFNTASSVGGLPVEVFYDDLVLTTSAVPEPGTWALLGGAGWLMGRRPGRDSQRSVTA